MAYSIEGVAVIATGLDGSHGEGQEIGEHLSGLEVLLVGPVVLKEANIVFDLSLVHEIVLGDGRCQLCGVFEDLGPGLDGCDVVGHAFAGVQRLGDLQNDDREFERGLSVVVPATLTDVSDSDFNLLIDEFSALEASLDFRKVVVLGHTEHESSDEVSSSHHSSIGCSSKHFRAISKFKLILPTHST